MSESRNSTNIEMLNTRSFNAAAYGLQPNFRLTKFADLKGRAPKVSQNALNKLLLTFREQIPSLSMSLFIHMPNTRFGVGYDCSVTPIRNGEMSLIQTVDLLYPIIENPYLMGRIACSNVLSDLYAMGVTHCDNILMILGASLKLTDKERDVVMQLMISGFKDVANEVEANITGGHTAINPWCMIGGVATSVCLSTEYIVPENAIPGDVIVLTKPLGTQVAITAYQWLESSDKWNRIKLVVSEEDVRRAYEYAMQSMLRLNRTAAQLMHKYNAHAATDVSGFGLLGHAQNLAEHQKNETTFVIHNLPIFAKMTAVVKACGNNFQLHQGTATETCGGLLICLPREQAAAFCKEIEQLEGFQSWIIGIVEKGNRGARIIEKPRIIEVHMKNF